jgi:hypothetical protein
MRKELTNSEAFPRSSGQADHSLSMLAGPLPPLLTTALSLHTQILELYADDCLIAFDPAWPGYAAYHTAYAASIQSAAAAVGSASRP